MNNKNHWRKIIILLICFIPFRLFASVNETLPTFHWSYDYIEALQACGFCLDLLQMNLPYTRGEVAKSLVLSKNSFLLQETGSSTRKLFQRLFIEFDSEMKSLQTNAEIADGINFRSHIRANLDHQAQNKTKYRGIYRAGFGASVGKNLYAFSGVNFNQYDYNNPAYKGYKWRGVSGYAEQAYIRFNWKRFHLKIGRDFLKWGAGQSGTLVFSNIARPMDQFLSAVNFGPFKFTFVASELDRFAAKNLNGIRVPVRRFLSGHRLDLSLYQGRIQAAISELVVYGGENASFDVVYLNPMIFYHGATKNGASDSNVLPTLDLLLYAKKNLQFYSSLLIDDIQIEKTGPGDLEPNEIAWLAGMKWADPAGMKGMTLNAEYVRVANRTYKTPHPPELFTHRGIPLGYPLGNDVDYWQLGLSKWFRKGLWLELETSQTRKGEGSLFTPWDEPWMAFTIKEGYSEPFPTGVVEKKTLVSAKMLYYYSVHWGVEADIFISNRKNADHVSSQIKKNTFWRIGLNFNGELFKGLN